ncbi:DNA-directed RNA polymerase III subunit RPC3 [Phytophthora pseudosyringae]|uniref:DNA-directed RNA polymerase III subunit RPC3 n=1 Tax=Phytophthora pseudosyringae TaxID=221518 RepID=A0A8T1V9Z9_9STRA|nr:DNA-directed RNA polymerase III subunit RPC3 [Phytophthora pseudosyringae]
MATGDKRAKGFATRSERALVLSVVREDFGDAAEKVAKALLRSEGLRLAEIAHKLQRQAAAASSAPSVHEIKCALLKLLQHNLLDVAPAAATRGGAPTVAYNINVQEALYRLRFPKFIELAKETFGVEGEVIMEEVLVQGRVRMDQSLETMAYSLAEQRRQGQKQKAQDGDEAAPAEEEEIGDEELDECRHLVREAFVEMAKKRYISRVHPLDLKVAEAEDAPEFPASIMRGQDRGPTSNLNSKSAAATAANVAGNGANANGASKNGKAADEDGITVRGKKRKAPSLPSKNAVPVELQMMLDADEAARKEKDDSEAEWEPSSASSSTSARGSKRKKNSKRAKLPSRGTSSGDGTTGGETSGEDAPNGSGAHTDERSLVWRFGETQLLRDLRHKACIRFATENINAVAGVIVAAMLQHSAPREREKDEPTSAPVSARDLFGMESVKKALPPEANNPWRLLLNYIMVMCRDKSGMVMKVAQEAFDPTQARAGDGGQYVVHMQKIVEFLQQATTHAYIQDKYGVASARIVRLLMEKRQLEQKTIGELALLPSNDARHRLYELYTDKLLKMQEIPKRADHNPAFTFFSWSVDMPQMQTRITERVQDSLCRLRRRRKFEAEENKELIARSEQLVEANDLDKFDKLSRSLDRLDRAIIHLDVVAFLKPPARNDDLDFSSWPFDPHPAFTMDYYELLQVPRGATEQEIKKAYRKLAMKWHPDKNKNNLAEAQYRFQEISEAYDVLSDPERRAIFDQYGYDGLKNGVPDENGGMRDGYAFNERASEDVFSKFFGTSNPFGDFGFGDTLPFASSLRKKGPEKAEPIVRELVCTLEELFLGTSKSVVVERKRLQHDELVDDAKTFVIKIKPGWKTGTKVTFDREGNETRTNEAGDVIFEVVQQEHTLFKRDGTHLVFAAKLKLSEALGDYCVEVPTLDGRKLAISCNEVVNPSSEKVVKKEGMPISNQPGERGDLRIRFDIAFPRHLTTLQKTALLKILG